MVNKNKGMQAIPYWHTFTANPSRGLLLVNIFADFVFSCKEIYRRYKCMQAKYVNSRQMGQYML